MAFGDSERIIVSSFPVNDSFVYDNIEYKIVQIVKPRPSKGECKTDIYILGEAENGNQKEFKVSVKQPNADFLENKMTLDRAIEILGNDAPSIISNSISSIRENFEDDYLIHFISGHRTGAKTIRIGWKFEFTNKSSGKLSGLMDLSEHQVLDVYSGTNLPDEKRNCPIDGKIVSNSGVANYIWVGDTSTFNKATFFDEIEPIENYAKDEPIYFACKAINYRAEPNKWDGNRPLSVYVDWRVRDGKLSALLVFDNPLTIYANSVGENIRECLKSIGVDSENFDSLKEKIDNSVKYY